MASQPKYIPQEGHKTENQSTHRLDHGLQPRQMARTMGRTMNRWGIPLPSGSLTQSQEPLETEANYPSHQIKMKGDISSARPVAVNVQEESRLSEIQELPPERVIPELQESVGKGGVNRKEDVEIVQYYLLELGLLTETDTIPHEAGTLLEEAQIPHLIAALYTFQEEVLHWQNRDANIGGPSSKTLEALKTTTAEQAKAQMEKYPAIKAKREADAAAKAKADAEAKKKREEEAAKLKASQAAKKKEHERIEKLRNEPSDQNNVEKKLQGLESNKEIVAFLSDYIYINPAFVVQAIKNNSGWVANENTDDLSFAILTKIGKSKLGSIDKELLQYFRATLDSGWTGDEELEWMQAMDGVLKGTSRLLSEKEKSNLPPTDEKESENSERWDSDTYFEESFMPTLLSHEGGYQNRKTDSGNYIDGKLIGTNHGISAPVLKEYLGRTPSVSEMKELTTEQATEIYKKKYWDKPKVGEINDKYLALQFADMYVNSGANAIKIMQRAVNNLGGQLNVDGGIGPKTLKAINNADPKELHEEYKKERIKFYEELYQKKPEKYGEWIDGWKKRANSFVYGKN